LSALLVAGLGRGVVLAAQVGPVTLLIVHSVLRGGRAIAVGVAMAGAVATIDVLYATIGLAGAGRLLAGGAVRLPLGLLSAGILIAIGARTAWTGLRARIGLELSEEVVAPRRAFVTAVAATAFNPLTITLWTVTFPAAAPSSATDSVVRAGMVIMGVALGTLIWYCGFATAVAFARRYVGIGRLRLVGVGTGLGLAAFGGLLGYRTVEER
jgi:threonine/homoserine/homoserine lactone efflux protein